MKITHIPLIVYYVAITEYFENSDDALRKNYKINLTKKNAKKIYKILSEQTRLGESLELEQAISDYILQKGYFESNNYENWEGYEIKH